MRYFPPPTPDLNTQGIYSDEHTHHFPQLKMSLREESDGRYGGVGKDGEVWGSVWGEDGDVGKCVGTDGGVWGRMEVCGGGWRCVGTDGGVGGRKDE